MKIKHELEISFKEYQRSYVKKTIFKNKYYNNYGLTTKFVLKSYLTLWADMLVVCVCACVCVCVCVCVCDRRGSLILQNHLSY